MRLSRKHDVVESALLEVLYKLERRGNKLLRLRQVVPLGDTFVERTGIDTDANGRTRLTSRIDHSVDALPVTDVARVDAQLGRSSPNSPDCKAVIEMNVSHDRHGRLATDAFEGPQRLP
ncbi:Uncharacterised protein [Collinsella intestinalis]|nr:Uncharacterised protein [Collinsella intestinalis]